MWRVFLVLFPFSVAAQIKIPLPECSEPYYRYVINALAHDSMEGRLPGTVSEKKSARFIENEFKRARCSPLNNKKFTYPFQYYNPDSLPINSTGNVIAKIETKNSKCIIVGAHYDHIGMGKHHSLAPFTKAIHNGADDNASGVAMMLSLAAWSKAHRKELKYDLIFVAFAAEEDGLYGSKHFLTSGILDTSAIYCYLNFDMLGHLNTTTPILKIEGLLEHPELDEILMPDSMAGFNVRKADPIFIGGSDNYSFEVHQIPGLSFSTGITEQYHKPEDDADLINYSGMLKISKFLCYSMKKIQTLVRR